MNRIKNPFAPGAGSPPPEFSGRDEIISDAEIALQRMLVGKHSKSQILLGLRGTGKTVLLRNFVKKAAAKKYATSFIEAPDNKSLATLLYPKVHQALREISLIEKAKQTAHNAMRALHSFASVFHLSVGDVSLAVDPAVGIADSGILEYDLGDLFVTVGKAAQAANIGWAIFIDEVQYLSSEELSALIVAIHRTNQEELPVMFFGAGLPQVAALTGDAKSYAERLFDYYRIDALDKKSSFSAIKEPIEGEGESISTQALAEVFSITKGYPFFLQEWGFQLWNRAKSSPIKKTDVISASPAALDRLDKGFFRVRFDRLTPKEQEYVFAMSKLGAGPYRSSDVADILNETPKTLGPCRARIIHKGMVYSPAHGDIAFTVPMFEKYLQRISKKG